jgi:Protein of unknown function (DUF1573)
MSKKRRKKSKTNDQQSVKKDTKEKHLQNRKWVFVILIEIIIAITAVILFSKGFGAFTSDSKNQVTSQSAGIGTDNDHSVPSNTQGPSIHFPEQSYDFGTISQGAKVSHTFVVKNIGAEPLKLIRAQAS